MLDLYRIQYGSRRIIKIPGALIQSSFRHRSSKFMIVLSVAWAMSHSDFLKLVGNDSLYLHRKRGFFVHPDVDALILQTDWHVSSPT